MTRPRRRLSPRRTLSTAALLAVTVGIVAAFAVGNAGADPTPSATAGGPDFRPVDPALAGRELYVSPDLQAATWAREHDADWLEPITLTPQARWVNGRDDLPSLRNAARSAAAEGRLLVAVAYAVPNRGCAGGSEGAGSGADYSRYVAGLVRALNGTDSAVVLEPDAVPADCFDSARADLLTQATTTLTEAGHHVYIDAGHPGWRPTGEIAERLLRSGITEADGFAVNVSARSTVEEARAYGEELSSLVGGRHFVVDTSRGGLGESRDADGDVVWCNPARQALGPAPSTEPVGRNDALLWVKNPGESDGSGPGCGDETGYPGLFSPRQARTLVADSPFVTQADQAALPPLDEIPRTDP